MIKIPTLQVSRNPRTHAYIYMGIKYDCCLNTGRIMLPNKLTGMLSFYSIIFIDLDSDLNIHELKNYQHLNKQENFTYGEQFILPKKTFLFILI